VVYASLQSNNQFAYCCDVSVYHFICLNTSLGNLFKHFSKYWPLLDQCYLSTFLASSEHHTHPKTRQGWYVCIQIIITQLLSPVAVAKCLTELMSQCVNWYLEINDVTNPVQSGFCKERSATDHLVHLESFIREAFIRKQHAVAIFFDSEKAYDTTWKYGILSST